MVREKPSERQACKLVGIPSSAFRYKKVPKDDNALMNALEELIKKQPPLVSGNAITGSKERGLYGIINAFTGCKLLKLNIGRKIKRRLPSE